MILEVAQKLLSGVCVGVGTGAPAGTTWARSSLATSLPHGEEMAAAGFLDHPVHHPQTSPQAPLLPAALQPPAGCRPFLPHRPWAVPSFSRCSQPSCPAPCAPAGSKAGNCSWAAAPRLGERRGRKGPGTPDKPLLYCQSKVSR